ncbi:MAG: tetratricopeptide repeat protein [Deltaproteobacteria bacterium]|nr:tetratricopeptide repeat protein [Deltaproteobacteria bacterium]
MSAQKIRTALGLLQDDADNENAWLELQDAITAPDVGMTSEELVSLLEAARREHEMRREWSAVATLLEYGISLIGGSPQEPIMQAELARVLEDELLEDVRATAAYKRLLEIRPGDPTATEAVERNEDQRAEWRTIADRNIAEARKVDEPELTSSMLATAAEMIFRYGRSEQTVPEIIELLEESLKLDPKNRRSGLLLERVYRDAGRWEDVARVLESFATEASSRDERFAALIRLARVVVRRLGNEARGVAAYERALDLSPGYAEAMSFLSDFFSKSERWEHLVAMYEDQLRGGGYRSGQDLGIWLQIAMVQWRMRGHPELAEPYFDKVRRAEPAHPGMLNFYREWCEQQGDVARLMSILTDAQRSLGEGEQRTQIAGELAKLAETREDSGKAIEQYKTLLRQDPDHHDARAALKRLYRQTEAWTSLIDVLRQELERTPTEERERRLLVLREIAEVYRDKIKSDSALVTVLGQILALDDKAVDAVRELCRVYEALQRWRDLLVHQQKLAELSDDREEKLTLLRAAGKRWMEQFQNVQNATEVYEAIFRIDATDEEARARLRELYNRRRAWPQLYALLEKEVEVVDESQKLQLYVEMAKLASERLDKSADAISLYKRVLEIDPNAAGIMDALEKQAERDKDFATVAEVLERRVEQAADENTRINVLQKLGQIYSERLNDPRKAAGAWRRVLEIRPGQSRALRVLRDAYLAAEDYDGLTDLYSQNEDWEGLAEVLSSAADKAADPSVKVDLSFRVAEVYEGRLTAPERAFRAYERVLSVRPDDTRAARALVPIYESDERWSRLPALYEILLAKSEDADEKLSLLRKLADVTGHKLSDKAAALAYARRGYEFAPRAEGALQMLEDYARAAGAWEPFVNAIEGRLAKEKDMPEKEHRYLQVRLGEVYATELGRADEAIKTYRALVEEDPSDDMAISTLDRILRATDRRDDLRWLFELRIKRAPADEAVRLLVEWATLEEEVFSEAARAVALFQRALGLDAANAAALSNLPRLLVASLDLAGAAQVIEQHRDLSDGRDRGELELQLAELYPRMERYADSLDACVRALDDGADADRAIKVLDNLAEVDATRARAAEVLVEVHAKLGDASKEASALGVLIDCTADRGRRLELLSRLIDVCEKKLADPPTALDVVLKAVAEFPEELVLWNRASDLAGAAQRPSELAKAYKDALEATPPLADAIEVELCERAASLHDELLGDQDGAIPYLNRVLARQPANDRAFLRLKQILTGRERWADLEALYAQSVTGTTDPVRRVELLAEVAIVCEEIIEDAPKAIDYYERILEIDTLHEPSVLALEKLYASEKRYEKLVQLLEHRLETAAGAEVVEIKLRLGSLQLDNLANPARALPHVEDVLRIEPNQRDARALVERILEVPELRSRAAEVLEVVYEARGEIRDLVRVLDIRLESAQDDDLKRDLLRRIATLRDERLADDTGAVDALAKLVPLDPIDVQARSRLVDIGRRIGAHERVAEVLSQAAGASKDPETRGSILMEVASIYRDQLSDTKRAENVYRRILEIDAEDANLVLPAARALEEIYASAGNHGALVEMLRTEVKLENDGTRRAEIYGRLGEICETITDDQQGAIDAWRARLGDNPADVTALSALERLYEKVQAWRELVEVLRAREQSSSDSDERRRLMIRIAQTLTEKLSDVTEGIASWRAILEEFGPDRPTLQALEALYEKAERWVDLAETLDADLNLAEEPADRLALLVRLGDVRRTHQDDLMGALEAYRQALTIEPSHGPSRNALEQLLEQPAARRDAAQVLHPLYEADGDHERLLRVVQIEAETSFSPSERLDLLEQAVRVAEGPLSDPRRAFEFAVSGLKEAAGTDSVQPWLEKVERLATATRRFPDLVTLLREVVGQILDGDVQLDVTLRIAELARTELADRDLAREYYIKALDIRGDDRRALVALESLYEEAGDANALLNIIRRRVDVAENEQEKKQLLFRQARLCSEVLQDRPAAISVYESVLDIDLDADAIQALEKLYTETDRFNDLVALYERQLERDPADKADLRVKIAQVANARLDDPMRAFDELGEALAIDGQHEGAIAELERLLESAPDPEHRARAAEMLEPFYLNRAEWKRVKVTIEARLASSQDSDKRRELLRRLALMEEEQEENFASALETTAKLLHEDITDQDTWRQLESQAKVAGAEKRLAEIFASELEKITSDEPATAKLARRTGELFAQLGQIDRALTFYRRALDFEPDSRELFTAIDELLIKAERPQERVALYTSALDHRFDPVDRIKILHTIADLERNALGDLDKAIDTYRSALDVDQRDAISLDALTELYRQRGRFNELAELYLQRAENEEEVEKACEYRLALARLQRDEIKEIGAAIDQYEEIVRRLPSHKEAVADLEALMASDDDNKERIVEILLPIHEGADDWRKLIHLNAQRFDLAGDDVDRVNILRETSRLWEQRGNDKRRAFEALRAAFEINAEDADVRAELERLAEALAAWDELAEAYEAATADADGIVLRDLLGALAVVHDQRRDDPRRALQAYERLFAVDETDPAPLEKMDYLATLLSDWTMLVRVLTRKAELVGGDEERAGVWRRVGEAKRDMLEDAPGAIQAYERALELDPMSAWTIDCMIDLYEQKDDARRLVELYQRRVELAGDDEADLKYQLLVQSAERYEKQINDRQAAIDSLRSALEVRPADRPVLRTLEGLYRAESMWSDLLDTLRLEANVAETQEDRVALRREIGKLLAGEMAEASEALEAFRLVLEESATDKVAVDAVRQIGDDHEELRLTAADILEPVLRNNSQFDTLVAVLEMRLKAQNDAADRARTLRSISVVYDQSLSDASKALDAMLRAFAETPDDQESHGEIERLAGACSGFGRYADSLAERAAGTFDGVVARDLWTRLGRIAEEKLSDEKRAVEAYAKALDHAGDAPDLLEALDRLHSKLDNHHELGEILERRVSVETDPVKQADLYHRLAVLQIKAFKEKSQGLETLRMALERAPEHEKAREVLEELTEDKELFEEAATALETVYRARADFQRLATLFEKRISFAGSASDRLRMRHDLARVLEDQASDTRRAQRVLEDALGDEPSDLDTLKEIERLAAINSQWTEAARAFAKAMEGATEIDSATARDLFARLAGWYRDKLADARSAEDALGKALARDPENLELVRSIESLQREPGRERDLIDTLRKRALLEIDSDKRRDLFREAATLAEGTLHDETLAEQVLRQLVEHDEAYLWAFEELTRFREKAGDFPEVVKLLLRRAELTADGPAILTLKHKAAEVLREKLHDNSRSLEIFEEIFDAEPNDKSAATALRELYAAEKRDKDLSSLLERLIDVATSAKERNDLRLELAHLLASKFDAVSDAIGVLHKVLEEEPGQTEAVVSLSQLYEKSGRDQELAELLTSQIDLAKGRGDSAAELTFTVRLGEVYESRLGDTAKAIEAYQQVLSREPLHRGALEALGRLYEAKGEPAQAAEILEKVLAMLEGEEAINLAMRLADLFGKVKDDAGARRVLENGLKSKPDSTAVRERLRKLYERTGAWAEVADLIAQDAEAAPDAPAKVKLLRAAADIHATKRKDGAAAAALLEKASELAPDDRDLLLSLCDSYSSSGRGKDAVKALEKIVESYAGKRVKELADIHHRLAKAYAADGEKERALAELDQAFRINPGNLAILVDLGVLAMDMNDLERAQKTFRALLLQRLDDKAPISKAEVFYWLGEISHRQGDDKKAIQMLERALENDASFQKAQDLLKELKK